MAKKLTNRITQKQYTRIVAIFLTVVIALPLIIQPGHYLFIKHGHFHQQAENTLSQKVTHFACAIDNFHLTEITFHPYDYKSRIVHIFTAFIIVFQPVFSKQESIIPFSLRAPPLNKEV